MSLPVQVRGHEPPGNDQPGNDQPGNGQQESSPLTTHLIDVSHRGARVGGIAIHLKAGEVVNLVSDGCDARFLIIWVGEPGTPQEGQIGLQTLATE